MNTIYTHYTHQRLIMIGLKYGHNLTLHDFRYSRCLGVIKTIIFHLDGDIATSIYFYKT